MLVTRLTSRVTQAQIRHVRPVPFGGAGPVGDVYRQVARDFGMLAPPVSLHAPAPAVLAASWMLLRETLVASGSASRAAKEAVAASVSRANACPYCVDVHGAVADRLPSPSSISLDDPSLRAVALTFHYLNRMVNTFLPSSPLPASAGRRVRSLAGSVWARFARRRRAPGASLSLLPPAPLPPDLEWASGSPVLSSALARAAEAYTAAGEASVPFAVRQLVRERVEQWDGKPPGVGSSWAAEAAAGLPEEHRALGRFALLVALASYQVVAVPNVDDRRLIEVAAWASFTAARRLTRNDLVEGGTHVPTGRSGC
jgi:alkylhydroperoxidase family enzyme